MRRLLRRLLQWRTRPPTFFGVLLSRQGLPSIALLGCLAVLVPIALDAPRDAILVTTGMFIGVSLRMVALARMTARVWPLQEPLFDWNKIEDQARELNL